MSRLALGVLMQLPQGSIFIASSPSHENSNTYTKVSLPSASFHYNKSPLILTSTVFCFQFLSLHLPSGSLSSQLQVRLPLCWHGSSTSQGLPNTLRRRRRCLLESVKGFKKNIMHRRDAPKRLFQK